MKFVLRFFYLIDEGDYLPWVYYPTSVLLSYAAAQLPWSGGAVKEYVDESSNRTRDIIENLPRLNIYDDYKTKDSRMIPISWNELSLQLPSDSKERDILRHTPAYSGQGYLCVHERSACPAKHQKR